MRVTSITVHDPPERLLAGVAAALGDDHAVTRAMRTMLERLDESDKRQRELEMQIDRLDRNRMPR